MILIVLIFVFGMVEISLSKLNRQAPTIAPTTEQEPETATTTEEFPDPWELEAIIERPSFHQWQPLLLLPPSTEEAIAQPTTVSKPKKAN